MFSKKDLLFRKIFFTVLFIFGFSFFFSGKTFALCDGTDSPWEKPPKEGEYKPGEILELQAVIVNKAEGAGTGFKNFTFTFNGWRENLAIPAAEHTYTLGQPGDGSWNGSAIKFIPIPDYNGKPAWRVILTLRLTTGYIYANNVLFTWTGTDEQPSTSCQLGTIFHFSQEDVCQGGDGTDSFEWILTTGDTPYTPGSVAVTSIKMNDWQGITDDISFFFDGWEFQFGKENNGWVPGSELTVTGKSGDTTRVATMKVPIVSNHADGWHRINYKWTIKNSFRRCSTHNMILVSNPGVKAETPQPSSGTGGTSSRIMPKTGLFDSVNKTIVVGVGFVVLGLIWTLISPLFKRNRQVYFVTSSEVSKSSKFIDRFRFRGRVGIRRSKFEKKI